MLAHDNERSANDERSTTGTDLTSSNEPSPSEAVILAAGEGRRLRPLTRYQPKPMLPLANCPVIEYVLDALVDARVDRAVIVVGHRRTHVQDCLGHEYRGLALSYVVQRSPLGSGHALQQAADEVDGEFLVANGDNVIDATMVRDTVAAYRAEPAVASVAVAHSDDPQDYGVVRTEDGNIVSISESTSVTEPTYVNAGVYMFTGSIFDALASTDTHEGELRLTDAIHNVPGLVTATRSGGAWFDPSYPWDALWATSRLLSLHADLVGVDEPIADSASVHEQAIIEEPALVGPGCEIGAGAVVRAGTCLRENVRVGSNATVERSIVDTDGTIGANAMLRDTIVGPGVRIGSGTVSSGRSATLVLNGREYRDRRIGGVIGDHATVGSNVTIVPGTRIGPDATIDHGATVDGQVAEGTEVIS